MIGKHTFISILLLFLIQIAATSQPILTLDDAVQKSLENNYNILIARNETAINLANNTAGNAGVLPIVALNFGQNFNINNTRQELFSGDLRNGNGAKTNALNANLQASWTVYNGMRMFVNKKRLEEIENFGKINLQLQMENTVAQVMNTYYNLEQQYKRIETIEQAITISKERVALAQLKKEAGSGSGIPILQAEVDINSDSSVLISQQLVLKNLKIILNELMGMNPEYDFIVSKSEEMPLLDYTEVSQLIEKRNKLLLLADKSILLSNLGLQQWQSNRYPTIDINAGYNFSRQNAEIGILKFSQNSGVSFGLTGRWNIFNGWNNKREIQVAKLNIESNKLAKDQLNLSLKSDLLSLFNTYSNAIFLQNLEDKNVAIAQQNLNITTEKMRIGTINSLELRQAQLNLIDAQFRKISASFDAKLSALELLRLSGSLIPN